VNIVSSLGTAALSTLVIGVAYPVYLHYLGYQQYGLWLMLSTVLVMAQLGNLGISPALLKLVAEDFAAGDVDGVYHYLSCGMLSLLVSGAVLMSAVLLLRHPLIALLGIAGPGAALAHTLLPYIAVLSISALIADALSSVVAGLGRYDLVNYTQLTGQALTVLTAVVLFKLDCGIWGLLIANAACILFLSLVSLLLIRRITRSPHVLRLTWDQLRFRRMLTFGSWVFGASILNTVFNPLNKIFVTRYAGIAAVPVYDIAYATCFKIRSLFESGFRALTPAFSSLNAVRPREANASLASAGRKGLKLVLYGGTLLYLLVFLFCEPALRFWLRGRFRPDLPSIFRIMLLGSYASLWGAQSWYSLLGFGKSPHILFANLAMIVSNIAWVLLWSPATGQPATLTTVTIGTCLGLLASTLYLRWQGARLGRNAGERSRQPTTRKPVAIQPQMLR